MHEWTWTCDRKPADDPPQCSRSFRLHRLQIDESGGAIAAAVLVLLLTGTGIVALVAVAYRLRHAKGWPVLLLPRMSAQASSVASKVRPKKVSRKDEDEEQGDDDGDDDDDEEVVEEEAAEEEDEETNGEDDKRNVDEMDNQPKAKPESQLQSVGRGKTRQSEEDDHHRAPSPKLSAPKEKKATHGAKPKAPERQRLRAPDPDEESDEDLLPPSKSRSRSARVRQKVESVPRSKRALAKKGALPAVPLSWEN